MANDILLKQGGYSKFTQGTNTQSTQTLLQQMKTILTQFDELTEQNLQALIDNWNKFIEANYEKEKDKWQLDFKILETTQGNIEENVNISEVDNSIEVERSSVFEQLDSLLERLNKLNNGN